MILQNWRHFWFGLVVSLTVVFSPVEALGAEIHICDPLDPKKCSYALEKGADAPFGGQLLTTELAITLGQRADGFDNRLKLELDYQKKLTVLEVSFAVKASKLTVDNLRIQNNILREYLARANNTPWYKTPTFVAITSVVLTVGIFIGVSYTLDWMDNRP